MFSQYKKTLFVLLGILLFTSCDDDFLTRAPLDAPSTETFWKDAEQAEMWVNNLYNGLGGIPTELVFEAYSDNAWGRTAWGANNIANGRFEPNDGTVNSFWNYRYIRLALEYFENVERVPDMPQQRLDELSGQVHFHLAYQYYRLMTFYRDVPLVTEPLNIDESDVPKNSKEEVLTYILEQLDLAIAKLPTEWPSSENGRITKGAALALKARVLLFNERWSEAASTAEEIMNLNIYELHPNFEELFLADFNNSTNEVILSKQYAENANTHNMNVTVAPVAFRGYALVQPTNELQEAFRMIDGLPIDESPMYDSTRPFENRDPRLYHTLLWHGSELNGQVLDLTGSEFRFSATYLYFRKYIGDFKDGFRPGHVNWKLFRYAEVLLTYAEAKNELNGPEDSIYQALDQIRERAGMPPVDRNRYNDQSSLRELIRNERRVEFAGEGLRYFDIIRWRIAEDVLNKEVKSMNLENWSKGPVDEEGNPILTVKQVESRVFDPSRHYVWPIPQDAIDRSDNILTQHQEWQ